MDLKQSYVRRRAGHVKLILVAVLLVAGVAFTISRIRAGRLPTMQRADFEAAKANWASQQMTDYEITVEVSGMQPGIYEVTVEGQTAVAATFDGRSLKRQRTFGTWAVTGMFDTLARDLETNEGEHYLMLGAEFHPEYGIPMKYERIEMRTGAHDALQWKVTRFHPQP